MLGASQQACSAVQVAASAHACAQAASNPKALLRPQSVQRLGCVRIAAKVASVLRQAGPPTLTFLAGPLARKDISSR